MLIFNVLKDMNCIILCVHNTLKNEEKLRITNVLRGIAQFR